MSWPWWLLWPWTAVWVGLQIALKMSGQSWHFFAQGGQLLFAAGPGTGLQLYAAHPDLQIGPLALAVSGVLRRLGPGQGELHGVLLMSATGPLVLCGGLAAAAAGRTGQQIPAASWPGCSSCPCGPS